MGVEGVFLARFIVSFGTTIFLVAYVRDWIHIRYFQFERLRGMVRYAVPLVPTLIAFWVVDVIDRYFLKAYGSTAQVGIYEIGYSIAAVVALGTGAFQQAWIPFAMSIQETPEAKHVYANTLVAYTWLGSLACVAATVFAPEALRLLTTKAYYGADTVVACLAFSYLLMGAGNIAALGAALTKKTISIGAAAIASAAANVGLNFWLVPLYGKDGAAWATLLSSIVMPLYLFHRSQRLYPIPYSFGKPLFILVFALTVIKVAGLLNLNSIWLVFCGKIALLSLFLPLLLALRIITFANLKAMIQKRIGWSSGIPATERP
jgi:O-antigen/teichoic acid export membrane protein